MNSASSIQDEESDTGLDEDGKAKLKRRPRPEPLIIPPPKPSTFIAPSVYSSITSFQSNLRSPVRLMDNPLTFPPYTPPPILSPVREGSGLYFSTFLTNIAVTNQILPPPPTPKSAARSLLRSSESRLLQFFCSDICELLIWINYLTSKSFFIRLFQRAQTLRRLASPWTPRLHLWASNRE